MVLIFFTVSVMNNKALAFKIALPFHMIFRSGSLMSNVLMGFLVFGKRYTSKQIIAVTAVTAGIIISTFASVSQFNNDSNKATAAGEAEEGEFFWWIVGILMLTGALFLSSALGLFQEWSYSQYGKDHYKESMFYSHALALPFFAFLWEDITRHSQLYTESAPVVIPGLNLYIPNLWLYLLANVLTQYICIRGVFTLTGKTTSLTCTLVLSVRKFVSLIFSVWYFSNPFTLHHWIGTFLVFLGTTLYSWPDAKKVESKKEDKKTK